MTKEGSVAREDYEKQSIQLDELEALKMKLNELQNDFTKTCNEKEELEKKFKYIINDHEVNLSRKILWIFLFMILRYAKICSSHVG